MNADAKPKDEERDSIDIITNYWRFGEADLAQRFGLNQGKVSHHYIEGVIEYFKSEAARFKRSAKSLLKDSKSGVVASKCLDDFQITILKYLYENGLPDSDIPATCTAIAEEINGLIGIPGKPYTVIDPLTQNVFTIDSGITSEEVLYEMYMGLLYQQRPDEANPLD